MNAQTVLDRLKNLGDHEIIWLKVSALADKRLYSLKIKEPYSEYLKEHSRLSEISQYCMNRAVSAGKKRMKN